MPFFAGDRPTDKQTHICDHYNTSVVKPTYITQIAHKRKSPHICDLYNTCVVKPTYITQFVNMWESPHVCGDNHIPGVFKPMW